MKLRLVGFLSLGLIVGIVLGFLIFKFSDKPLIATASSCEKNYVFINKLLGCTPTKTINKQEYTEFSYNLQEYILSELKNNNINSVSVYFRDLVSGPTFGIKEQDLFIPASLLKLPLLITYLSLADENPEILTKEAGFSRVNNEVLQSLDGVEPLKPNTPYKIDELLRRMIVYSDNIAYGILVGYLQQSYPNENLRIQTLKDLGLMDPRNISENTFTVKSYSSLFRVLYNSSYLTPESSEKALKLMAESTFKEALVSGVPGNISVSHKFGEREGLDNEENQFHDCGIIYYPNNPYLLCVMTIGKDKNKLIEVIKTISKKVYNEVDSRKY